MLNTGKPVAYTLDIAPSDHAEQRGYLRLRELPVNELANALLVVKLEFDALPETLAPDTPEKSDLLRR